MLFVSYTRTDRDGIGTLLADLRALGHVVWLDEELSGGQVWWDEILAKIRQCDAFLFLVSPSSVESEACLLELQYATALHRIVIPVRIAQTEATAMPSTLETHQVVGYTHGDKSETMALARALAQTEAARPLPEPLPDEPSLPGSYFGSIRDQIKSREPLSLDQQLGLLHRLRARADDGPRDDVAALLHSLRSRDDLFASVAAEIDAFQASLEPQAPDVERRQSGLGRRFRRPTALIDRVAISLVALAVLAAVIAILGDLWEVGSDGWITWTDDGVELQRASLALLVGSFVALTALSFTRLRAVRRATSVAALVVALIGLLAWWWNGAIVDGLLLEQFISTGSGSVSLGVGLTGSGLSLALLVIAGVLLSVSAFSEQSA